LILPDKQLHYFDAFFAQQKYGANSTKNDSAYLPSSCPHRSHLAHGGAGCTEVATCPPTRHAPHSVIACTVSARSALSGLATHSSPQERIDAKEDEIRGISSWIYLCRFSLDRILAAPALRTFEVRTNPSRCRVTSGTVTAC